MCGGNSAISTSSAFPKGTSPRVRGKPGRSQIPQSNPGYIPACAGETNVQLLSLDSTRVHPRVCGGNSGLAFAGVFAAGTSPRVRGKQVGVEPCDLGTGYIPACAGETYPFISSGDISGVHPRVCGGNRRVESRQQVGIGTSPRVRGKRN